MSKPRKKYRPKPVKTCTLQLAMQGWAFLSKEDQEAKAAPVRAAVAFIAQGKAGSATRPHNSPFIKLPKRPNARPSGTNGAIKSVTANHVR